MACEAVKHSKIILTLNTWLYKSIHAEIQWLQDCIHIYYSKLIIYVVGIVHISNDYHDKSKQSNIYNSNMTEGYFRHVYTGLVNK
jgi:hypothetical protein